MPCSSSETHLILNRVYVHTREKERERAHTHTQVPTEVRRGCSIPWS